MRQSVAAMLATCALAVSGCGSDPVEEKFGSRAELPRCGTVRLAQTDTLEERAPDDIACMRAALEQGTGAELEIRSPTVEGDPVTEYYRVLPGGTVEVYVDATGDPNSDERWSYAACVTPEWLPGTTCD